MHPSKYAITHGDKAAIIFSSGHIVTYAELDVGSNKFAWFYRKLGLKIGDTIAILLPNDKKFFDIVWGAQRAGLVYVCISTKLNPREIEYIIRDSGAKLLISDNFIGNYAAEIKDILDDIALYMLGENEYGFGNIDAILNNLPTTPIIDERAGGDMLYSSGTTGRPKGIKRPLPEDEDIAGPEILAGVAKARFGIGEDTIYLSPAPLYHAAPLRWCIAVHRLGGTIVIMEEFSAELALQLIEKYRVNCSQWVPTHFVRMLKLPDELRAKYDVSSVKLAIHAAAPCPVHIKEAMLEWFGPVLVEYYAGTEGNGMTMIDSHEWLTHKGSVGRAVIGVIHICDDAGNELSEKQEGLVYFDGAPPFEYHNDSHKTQSIKNQNGWSTLGDVGYVDEEGFLYLTDRKSHMIISGGVNIYPQEVENLLLDHPKILDAAVIGAPDAEMGERVVAVIQLKDDLDNSLNVDALKQEISAWLSPQISRIKMPRQIDFVKELPRHPNGKLLKRILQDEYRKANII